MENANYKLSIWVFTDKWYHIVQIYNESEMVRYVDGLEVDQWKKMN